MDKVTRKDEQTHSSGSEKNCQNKSRVDVEIELSPPCIHDLSLNEAKRSIGKFFYENELDFNAVNSASFRSMISLISGRIDSELPTSEELRNWIFHDTLKEMHEYIKGIRSSWVKTGCSLLLDGWIDSLGRNLVNILVECPIGTIYLESADISDSLGSVDAMCLFIERILVEIGIHNVVQIVTCSTSTFMKAVGNQLMDKYRPIFWTVSASCCVQLMLEKLSKINLIKEVLGKAEMIRRFIQSHPLALKFLQDRGKCELVKHLAMWSTQPFLALENIVFEKGTLQEILCTRDAETPSSSLGVEGKMVADLIGGQSFWEDAKIVLKGVIPLVHVLEWMNVNSNDQMGCVYDNIDKTKEMIEGALKNKKSLYLQFWKVIDDVWDEFLYSPLHSAGYFLNPNLFYSDDVYIDKEVATGVLCCIVRATEDHFIQDRIIMQLEKYRAADGCFGKECSDDMKSSICSVRWWLKHGGECPELQWLAIRILSQQCVGASKFRLRRNLVETLLTSNRRDPIEQKWMLDTIFLQYNLQLQNFTSCKAKYVVSDAINIIDNKISCQEQLSVGQNTSKKWMEVEDWNATGLRR